MTIKLFLMTCLFAYSGYSQNLLPTIGQDSIPENSDPICYFPVTIDPDGSFNTPGPNVGDTVPDFTLYDMADNPVTLSNELQHGKYVLLIAGSYTCPVFRNKVVEINNLVQNYGNDVSVYVIYEMEAHPHTDTSLYFGYVNPGSQNLSSGILYDQPTTYLERKNIITDMNNDLTILAPILIDGPCNNYLNYFGPAPNNAYVIDTNGVVVVKQGWFDKYPVDMSDDIDSLLGGGGGTSAGLNGTFTFSMDTDTADYGLPGDILYVKGTFTNTHATDDVVIDLSRVQDNMPDATWSSAMCIDACLSSGVSQYTLQMPAGATQLFTMYFFTGSSAVGNVEMIFTNANDPMNSHEQMLYGYADGTVGVFAETEIETKIYPNPVNDYLEVEIGIDEPVMTTLLDASGRIVMSNIVSKYVKLDLRHLPSGLYHLTFATPHGLINKSVVKY